MATKHLVVHYCDLCGEETASGQKLATLELVAGDRGSRLDLCEEHAAKLRKAVEPYLTAGVPLNMRAKAQRVARGLSAPRAATSAGLREWARHNGYQVSNRGRIPAHVLAAYDVANAA